MYEPAPVSVFSVVYAEVPVCRLDAGVLGYPLVCARRVREQIKAYVVIDVVVVAIRAASDKLRHLHVYPHVCRAQARLLGVRRKAQADRPLLRVGHDALGVQLVCLRRGQADGVVKVSAVGSDVLDRQIGRAYALLRDRDA